MKLPFNNKQLAVIGVIAALISAATVYASNNFDAVDEVIG